MPVQPVEPLSKLPFTSKLLGQKASTSCAGFANPERGANGKLETATAECAAGMASADAPSDTTGRLTGGRSSNAVCAECNNADGETDAAANDKADGAAGWAANGAVAGNTAEALVHSCPFTVNVGGTLLVPL